MNFSAAVTVFVYAVFLLAMPVQVLANAISTSTTAPISNSTNESFPKFSVRLDVSQSRSLIDHQDGTRQDSLDIILYPSLGYSFGKFSSQIAHSRNLNDPYTKTENDFADIPITFSFKPSKLSLLSTHNSVLIYSLTAVVPVSQLSTKKDQLQTSLSGKVGISATPLEDGFSFGGSISMGQNFHAYEEDINGAVLNKYSSNQTLSLGYSIGSLSLSFDFINKTRWTYGDKTKSSFEHTEELGYEINKNLAFAVGHTNAGSTLKANGTDSNIDLIDEENSLVYGTLSLTY